MSIINNPLLLGADASSGGGGDYQIARSLRFNSADSAYLSRTPASAGNRKTWTWAGWVKRSALSAGTLFACTSGSTDSTYLRLHFFGDKLYLGTYATNLRGTTAVYRDASAWYHIVLAVDTTQATGSNRFKIYVNGVQVTAFEIANDLTQNADLSVNQNTAHYIGSETTTTGFFNGYLADVHFIDGQALTPSSFGAFDSNNVWQPKAYTGTYGTNGFKLNFSDNSAATATTLGKDAAGSNNWTPNNLSVTAGSGNDSLVDSPTNYGTDTGVGGEVRGNYCTLNPLDQWGANAYANGNLEVTCGIDVAYTLACGGIAMSSGKWYWEVVSGTISGGPMIGIASLLVGSSSRLYTTAYGKYYYHAGTKWTSNTGTAYGASYTAGDVIGVAYDADAGTLVFYKNGASQGTAFTDLAAIGPWVPAVNNTSSGLSQSFILNFGQRPFAYKAPAGFKALSSASLPAGTITTSGTFTGNANADGPFVYLGGVPKTLTINGNAVTWGTHADKLSNGFKVRTNLAAYNVSGSNTYTVTATGDTFNVARAQSNP